MTDIDKSTSDGTDWTEESATATEPTVPVSPVEARLISRSTPPRRRKLSLKAPPGTPPDALLHPTLKPTKSTITASPHRLPSDSASKARPRAGLSVLSAARFVFGALPYVLAVVSYVLPVVLVGVGGWWVVYCLAPAVARGLADRALAVPLGALRLGGGVVGGLSPLVAGVWCSLVDCNDHADQLRGGVARIVQRRADQASLGHADGFRTGDQLRVGNPLTATDPHSLQALDIFQSMIELSSSDQVGISLHPVE